jgi:formate-dependent nitrite reductase membrane component NrfD
LNNLDVMPASAQQAWKWPALANFILGGVGAGFYLLCFFTGFFHDGLKSIFDTCPAALLGPVTTLLGFAAVGLEAGRPRRAAYLLRNLRSSSLSKETLLWAGFIATALLDWAVPHPALRTAAVVSAVGFLLSQGLVLYQVRAIRNWHQPAMPAFFVSSGLASGFGFALLLGTMRTTSMPVETMAVGMAALFANAVVWGLYLVSVCSGRDAETAGELCRRRTLNLLIVVAGHLVPLCALWWWSRRGADFTDGGLIPPAAIAFAILMGVVMQKKTIVLNAAIMKKISIDADGGPTALR